MTKVERHGAVLEEHPVNALEVGAVGREDCQAAAGAAATLGFTSTGVEEADLVLSRHPMGVTSSVSPQRSDDSALLLFVWTGMCPRRAA